MLIKRGPAYSTIKTVFHEIWSPRSLTAIAPASKISCWSTTNAFLSFNEDDFFSGGKRPIRLGSLPPASFAISFFTSSTVVVESMVISVGNFLIGAFGDRFWTLRVIDFDMAKAGQSYQRRRIELDYEGEHHKVFDPGPLTLYQQRDRVALR